MTRLSISLLFIFFFWPVSVFASQAADLPIRIAVLGDSLTSGYGLMIQDSFPEQLEKALIDSGYNVSVINAGVSGDTTAGGLARLDWVIADEPDIVIVELGGNDALRGLKPEQTAKNLDAILSRLKQTDGSILLAGMQAPRNLGQSYYSEFDQIYPKLANKHATAFYPFFLDGVATVPSLNQPDGIHPNAEGVAVIVRNILPLVIDLLDQLNNHHKKHRD